MKLSVRVNDTVRGSIRISENDRIDLEGENFLNDALKYITLGETFATNLFNSPHLKHFTFFFHT